MDIWSLGCAFSIAATWIVLGSEGIRKFETLRTTAIDELIEEHAKRRPGEKILDKGDQFHDSKKVLAVVTQWHGFLKTATRKVDTITEQVLELVDNHMLVETGGVRISATKLREQLGRIMILQDRAASMDQNHVENGLLQQIEATYGVSMAHDTQKLPADMSREQHLTTDHQEKAPDQVDTMKPEEDIIPVPGIGRADTLALSSIDKNHMMDTSIDSIKKDHPAGFAKLKRTFSRLGREPVPDWLLNKYLKKRDFVSRRDSFRLRFHLCSDHPCFHRASGTDSMLG